MPPRRNADCGRVTFTADLVHVDTKDTDTLLTPREVADRLNVGLTSVYKMMNEHQLPFVQILSDRRIEPQAVQAFIARQRKAPRTSRKR